MSDVEVLDIYIQPCPDNGKSHDCSYDFYMYMPTEVFSKWLVEHDRAVAERTLLEAADAVLEPYPDPETCTKVFDPWDVDEFLRSRIPVSVSTSKDADA